MNDPQPEGHMASHIGRRKFLATLGGAAAAWPLAAGAQQPMPVIGYFSARSPVTDGPMLSAFRQGLNDTGFVEGRNVAMEFRWAEGRDDRLLDLGSRPYSSEGCCHHHHWGRVYGTSSEGGDLDHSGRLHFRY